jgi:peptidoglycan hydrolase CwlO-like protein
MTSPMMLKNRVYLSLVAAGVGFGLSLLVGRNFGKAFLTGSITLIAAQVGAIALESQYEQGFHQRSEKLRAHIRALQSRRQSVYQELQQLTQERDRLTADIYLVQTQAKPKGTLQPPANPWETQKRSPLPEPARPAISWTLTEKFDKTLADKTPAAAPQFQSNGLETRIQNPEEQTTSKARSSLQKNLQKTLTAQQQAEESLNSRQAELHRLQSQITQQQTKQEELAQTVNHLTQQREKLDSDLNYLQTQVQELEQYRGSLTQFFASAEPKRRQVETGSQALQDAIAQLQNQITSLHGELNQLEGQILDRRTEKEQLDSQLSSLKDQQRQLDPLPSAIAEPKVTSRTVPKPRRSSPKTPQIGGEWMDLMRAMTGSEFNALKAIAIEENPGPTLKRLSEENLTMPELLIDAINERALDTIGDIILEPGPDTGVSIIAQEYRDQVATLISTYGV